MKFLQKMLKPTAGPRPQHAPMSHLMPLLPPTWTPATFTHLVRQGYMKNVIVYRCIQLIVQGISSVPWLCEPPENSSSAGPNSGPFSYLAPLLAQPNPYQSWSAFIADVTLHLLLSGNAFIKVARTPAGEPMAFYTLNPSRVSIRVQNNEQVYEVYNGQQTERLHRYGASAGILHIKYQHPLHDTQGLSPLEVGRASIDQHNAVAAHNLSLLQNGGRPSGALVWKQKDFPITEEQRDQLRQQLATSVEGAANAGRVLVMEGDFEWREMGLSPKDLDFSEGRHVAAREIAMCFGVPPLLAGVPGEATYSNYKEARLHLWEETLLPLLHFLQQEFALYFNADETPAQAVSFTYNANAIPALVQKRQALWEKMERATFLTTNEKRRALGYPPVEGGDECIGGNHVANS